MMVYLMNGGERVSANICLAREAIPRYSLRARFSTVDSGPITHIALVMPNGELRCQKLKWSRTVEPRDNFTVSISGIRHPETPLDHPKRGVLSPRSDTIWAI